MSPQAIDARLTPEGAATLRRVLEAAARTLLTTDPVAIPLLNRFPAVVVQDSSCIGLPAALAAEWPGCGNATAPADASATRKLHVRLDLTGGTLDGPVLQPGRAHDTATPPGLAPLPAGALWIGDLGFFDLAPFPAWDADGRYWLSRLKAQTVLLDPTTGQRLPLQTLLPRQVGQTLDRLVQLGAAQRLPSRLLAVRVPPAVAAERRRKLHEEARRRRPGGSPPLSAHLPQHETPGRSLHVPTPLCAGSGSECPRVDGPSASDRGVGSAARADHGRSRRPPATGEIPPVPARRRT